MMGESEIYSLKEMLLKSHWPKCNEIAEKLFEIGTAEAKMALVEGLKGKRHHIRTAAIKTLVKFQDPSLIEIIRPFVNDASYETRMQAIEAIKDLSGKDLFGEKQSN